MPKTKIVQKKKVSDIFNACSDEHPKRKNLYSLAAEKMGLEPPEFKNEQLSKSKIVSNEKIKEALNYSFKYPDPIENISE